MVLGAVVEWEALSLCDSSLTSTQGSATTYSDKAPSIWPGEECTRNETADIKLNRAPFSLRCGDEAHPHDVLMIPPWRNLPHSANCAPSCWRTAHIIRFVPPHYSRRSPFISSSDQDFSHHALCRRSLLRPIPNGPPREKCRCPACRVRQRDMHGEKKIARLRWVAGGYDRVGLRGASGG